MATEHYSGLAELHKACGIPIAAGENVYTLMDFERFLTAQAVDFVSSFAFMSVGRGRSISMIRYIRLWKRRQGRQELYRLDAAIDDARRDVTMLPNLVTMFEQLAQHFGRAMPLPTSVALATVVP